MTKSYLPNDKDKQKIPACYSCVFQSIYLNIFMAINYFNDKIYLNILNAPVIIYTFLT